MKLEQHGEKRDLFCEKSPLLFVNCKSSDVATEKSVIVKDFRLCNGVKTTPASSMVKSREEGKQIQKRILYPNYKF